MDTKSEDEPPETKESAFNNAENASFIWGTGKIVTPQKHAAEVPSSPCPTDVLKSPLNYSTVTVEQLGITAESFVKDSSGKSPSYLKKSRRRSSVGARGSPETNHLIRFIAKRKSLKNAKKSSLAQDSHSLGSPALYQNANILRERLSAFQSAFQSIKESENMADYQDFSEAGREFTMTELTKKEVLSECHQSAFPAKLSKCPRMSSHSNYDENLTDAEGKVINLQIVSTDTDSTHAVENSAELSEKSSELGSTLSVFLVEESAPLAELTESSDGLKVADCVEGKGSSGAVSPNTFRTEVGTGTVSDVSSPATPVCRSDIPSSETLVLRSVLKKPSVKPCLESLQEHCNNLCDDETHPSLISNLANSCKEQKAEDQENCKTPAFLNMKKRKRVTFGEDLSPEVFDESLPANTPLRKGGTPVCKKDLSGISSPLLEQSPVLEPLPQPNFDDKGENLENIEPLQVSFAALSSPNKSSISETFSGTDTFSSSNNHEKMSSHKVGRVTRTSTRRNQLASFTEESVCNLLNTQEAQPCKEKKINRKKSQETKCTKRALPKKNQVLKSCRNKKGKRKKSVEKSLYGERDIASKKPLLSPIPELPEVSEMTPSVPSIRRMCSDDFSSNGKLEEMKTPKNPIKRKNLFPQNPANVHMNQGFNKYVSEFCHSYIKSSLSLGKAASAKDPNTNMVGMHENENTPLKAEIKSESENEPKTETDSASVIEEHIVSDHPKSELILQGQELSPGGQNADNLCEIFTISSAVNRKSKKQDDFFVAAEGKLQCNLLIMSDAQKECNSSEDVFMENIKESKCQSEDLGRKSAESSNVMSCREKKRRRRSMCYSDDQRLHLEENGDHKPSYSVGSSVEINLENSELHKDLSDAIEQTFQRTNSETKVRRSTRLQKDLENNGLVWISLPFPSTYQKTKRRTICTSDSRGFESMSPRNETVPSTQRLGMVPPVSGRENNQSLAADSSNVPGRRRESFCVSTLANAKTTTQSKHYRRRSFLKEKGGSSLTGLERNGHS
ncbi:cell division cycle-associated protein 2 [Carlito syrichta]|uniref:Cell division cycle-associated protein 2 n=1 Tax=Carlito syrichta TaxID=1868482 RepID=A0A1U7UGQ1_CARSF|nr:cell division cycle-associated protein 2 [Carlito syrichta]